MCNMLGCLPNDDKIENIEPAVKMWCFYNWLEDQNDKVDLAKNHAYIVGSFINPEAVRKILNEDGASSYSSSDEDFERSTQMISGPDEDANRGKSRKRKRRKLKSQI